METFMARDMHQRRWRLQGRCGSLAGHVIAKSASDEAIQRGCAKLDCFASLAMTG
jgi:hypothetical protein